MTRRLVVIALIVLVGAATLQGQGLARLTSAFPLWADSALLKAGFGQRYDFSSRLSPHVEFGDLDGDGLLDVAVAIVDQGRRLRGIAIIHRIDQSVHIVGAGQPVGSGRDELHSTARWGVEELWSYRVGIRVVDWHVSGWLIWNGHTYVWVQDSD